MNRVIKIILIVTVSICGITGIIYYTFMRIDFIGQKDPKVVEDNLKRWSNTILSAEYRHESDYCKVDLLDSSYVEISVGDKSGGTILNEQYMISNDTITVIEGVKHASKYLNTNKFIIYNNKLLFNINSDGNFDTLMKTMTIKFNNLKSK